VIISSNETSPLDEFLYENIKNITGKILDYGCGEGRFIKLCSDRELKIVGADTYNGIYDSWETDNQNIVKIYNNLTPFSNSEFQVILSNQTFEHIRPNEVSEVTQEITRILSASGFGINVFPTRKTIIEAHVGVPLVHLLNNYPRFQEIYLYLCFFLGIGYWRSENKRGLHATKTRKEWVNSSIDVLHNSIFYSSTKYWAKNFNHFGCKVENISYSLLVYAAPKLIKPLLNRMLRIKLLARMANILVELRLGIVLRISK
jgi:SAM-dependent methyltransferase